MVGFFFSSRRRHTRWPRDWSSDVCSSDLDGDAAAHAGEVAGGAGLAAVEGADAEALGEVAVGDEAVLVGLVGLAAVLADATGEALGHDEEEGGGDEEGGDAHVEEPGDGGGAVVGVEGGEDEVAGEGGADADLGGFEVAGFADEDDVGVLAEEGAEGGGEGAADFVVDLDLVDALEVVLDGVLGGHDVDVGGVDGMDGGVEGGGLARAGGAGDEDHAVGGADRLFEVLEGIGVEAELGEVELEGVFIEQAHDGFLPVDGGEGGDAEVDLVGVVAELDAAVLGEAAFGDVEVGHDLDAGDEGGLEALGGDHDLVEDAVHPEADAEDLFVGLEVDVGGAAADGVDQDHVDELDDGGLVGRLLELKDVDLGADLVLVEELDVADRALELLDDLADRGRLDVVVVLDGLADGALGGHDRQDLEVGPKGHVVEGEDVGGVGHGQGQHVGLALDRDDLVLPRHLGGDELEDVGIDVELGERDRGDAVLLREEADQLVFVDQVEPHEERAELLGGPLLRQERPLELVLVDQPFRSEEH